MLNLYLYLHSNYNLNNMRIQEVCKEKGVTMQELAKRMGVTYQALYANASGNPTIDKLNQIADTLGVSVCELIEKPSGFTCPKCGAKLKLVEE